jgi:hypothetical protein
MSFYSTFTNASINGWQNLNNEINGYVQVQQLQANNLANNDLFANALAVSGDGNYLLVGTGSNNRAIYSFKYNNGSYVQEQQFYNSGNYITRSIAINEQGNIAIVGAQNGSNGIAYIFTRSGNTWSEQTSLQNTVPNSQWFGNSVTINDSGNLVAIGAAGFSNSNANVNEGKVYIFSGSGNSWSLLDDIVSPNINSDYLFGNAVSFNTTGNKILIGEPGYNGAVGRGLLYSESGNNYSLANTVNSPNVTNYMQFGGVVALNGNGNIGIIGSFDQFAYTSTSVSTIFDFDSNTGTDISNTYSFGHDVTINASGNVVIIGQTDFTPNVGNFVGRTLYYQQLTSNNYTNRQEIDPTNYTLGASPMAFGENIDITNSGNRLVISAPNDCTNGNNRGAVYIFTSV